MVTVNIDRGNIYITDGTIESNNTITFGGSQKVVKINPTTKVDLVYDNTLVVLPIPLSKQNRGVTKPFSRILDLKRIKETLVINGILADEDATQSDTAERSSAEQKRDGLIEFGKNSGPLSVVWGQDYSINKYQTLWKPDSEKNEYGAFILKMSFTHSPTGKVGGDVGGAVNSDGRADQEPTERNISCIITLVRGKDM